MLKYNLSEGKITIDRRKIDIESMTYYDNVGVIRTESTLHGLYGNSIIYLNRLDGSAINYRDYLRLTIEDLNTFSFSFTKEMSFVVDNLQKNIMSDTVNGEEKIFLDISIADGYQHPFISNKDDVTIREFMYDFTDESSDDRIRRRCVGDYVLFNSVFRYKAKEVNEKKKYVLESEYDNTHDCEIWYYENDVKKTLHAIVPSTSIGIDDHQRLLVECTQKQYDEILQDNPRVFYCDDVRFFNYSKEETFEYTENNETKQWSKYSVFLQPNTELFVEIQGTHFPLSLSSSTNADDEDLHSINYVNSEIQKAKSKIIDYEKEVFAPVYYENGVMKEIKEIEFNLHFREHDKQSTDWSIVKNENIGDPWGLAQFEGRNDSTSDLLGKIGFDDDDVLYQHKSLQQSFLRLLFYDTPNRNNQSLLYYSTIFLDSNVLYGKYLKFLRKKIQRNEESQYVLNSDIQNQEHRLDTQLHCYDKFNNSGCSEGFYIYLFANAIQGNVPTPIYMKAEFNHAKYGVTIPLVLPKDSSLRPIPSNSEDFPTSYSMVIDSKNLNPNQTGICLETNLDRLNKDMHTRLIVEYNEKNKQTIWRLPNNDFINNGKIVLNLFEPKTNLN